MAVTTDDTANFTIALTDTEPSATPWLLLAAAAAAAAGLYYLSRRG